MKKERNIKVIIFIVFNLVVIAFYKFSVTEIKMDIQKTIKYFERMARANKSANLDERAEEYTQIAEWLKELKELKNNNGKEK